MKPLEAADRTLLGIEDRFARWPTGRVIFAAMLIAPLFYFLGVPQWGGTFVAVVVVTSFWARRRFFLRDLKWGFAVYVVLLYFTVLPHYVAHVASFPGDPTENVGDRHEGSFQWRTYDAAHNGTSPIEMYGTFVVAMRPGASIRVRPNHSKAQPGGYVVQVDGQVSLQVLPNVHHLTMAGRTATTTALLPPGTYEVWSWLSRDSIDVWPKGGPKMLDVRGGARVMPTTAVASLPGAAAR